MQVRTRIPNFQLVMMIGFIALIAGTSFTVYKKWWPWLMRNTVLARIDAASTSNMLLMNILMDNLHQPYQPHADALLETEKTNTPLNSIDLNRLVALPGVLDAFTVDFQSQTTQSITGLIPPDSLLRMLDRRKDKRSGGAAQMMRKNVGGLTRFSHCQIGGRRYAMLLRYRNTFYPSRANAVVGLVLDDQWYLKQVPSLLDSLTHENSAILFMAPQPPDTQWLKVSDPYRAANNEWKQTIGVIKEQDTLWWFGDPNVKIYRGPPKPGENAGYRNKTEPFDLEILIKIEFPEKAKELFAGQKIVKWLFPAMEIGIQVILAIIIFMFVAYRQQMKRNQIALGHLAHSVKTPVARLQLAADILEGGQVSTPEEERKIIQTVSGECRQLRRAVENAALSLEGGKIAIHKETGDLAELVRETTAAWQQSFDQVGIRLAVEGVDKPMQFSFDRDKLRLALDNLIDNALRHTYLNLKKLASDGATVTVALKSEGKSLLLSVSDSGAGIPQADMKQVFKRFSRSGKDPLTGVSGLGLGLALVKEIAEGHGGKVRVEEANKRGACFTLELPIS